MYKGSQYYGVAQEWRKIAGFSYTAEMVLPASVRATRRQLQRAAAAGQVRQRRDTFASHIFEEITAELLS